MKFLLVLAVVLVAFWIWRKNRREEAEQRQAEQRPRTPIQPTNMVECQQCGAHLPEGESVAGRQGRYCSAEHRRLHEQAPD